LLACGGLRADFTYEETSKITGGAIVGMMKFAGAFSKDARRVTEPTNSIVAIHGNRMVRKSQITASITDLDAETITTINLEKRTYTVMTFAQMKQAMEDMSRQMEKQKGNTADTPPSGDAKPDVKFKVKVDDTGQTRTINGLSTHEVIMTMTMEGTDDKSGAKGALDVTTDSWLAPRVPGYEEVIAFYRRMSERLNFVPGGAGGMLNRPDIARGMSELYKEGAKLNGIPVLQVVKMGGSVDNVPQDSNNRDNSRQSSSSSSSSSSSAPPTSVGGAIGSALGGRFGLGRKKKDQAQDQPADASNNGSASGSLLEMTMELTNYSSAPVDSNLFVIPAGYKQVEPEMGNRRSR
jgi:hypothetical protein